MTAVLWFFAIVIGPVLLLVALYWGFWRNRSGRGHSKARSEEGARRLRTEIANDPSYRED